MRTLIPNLSVLPSPQRKIWNSLRQISDFGFVLYGGTAIAIQLGHRISVDFDFFTEKSFKTKDVLNLFPNKSNCELREAENTVNYSADDGVKISLFGGLTFGRVGTPLICSDNKILVASLDDLMALKLKVLFDRISIKDYQDIAAMIRSGVNLSKGLAAGREMFNAPSFPIEAIKTMTWFHSKELKNLSEADKYTLSNAEQTVSILPHVDILSRRLSEDAPNVAPDEEDSSPRP